VWSFSRGYRAARVPKANNLCATYSATVAAGLASRTIYDRDARIGKMPRSIRSVFKPLVQAVIRNPKFIHSPSDTSRWLERLTFCSRIR